MRNLRIAASGKSEFSGSREMESLMVAHRDSMESKNEWNSFLEEKLALLKSYALVTDEMPEHLRKGDLNGIWIRLSRREEIAQKIEKVDSSLKKMMSAMQHEESETTAKFRGVVGGHHGKAKEILEHIALKEADLIPLMRGESEELKKELIRMRGARHAAASYHKPKVFPPRFLDARK
jgi:hypothetical protein